MSAISIQSLEKRHGENHVLKSVDLSIEAGEFIVLLGPSGCGKSTLLNAIAGLDPVDGGKILIAGTDVTDLDPSRRGISMVFQSYALYPTMSVRKNLSFGLRVSGVANAEIVERVERVSRMLQIEPFLDRNRLRFREGNVSVLQSAAPWSSNRRFFSSMNRSPILTPSYGPRRGLS